MTAIPRSHNGPAPDNTTAALEKPLEFSGAPEQVVLYYDGRRRDHNEGVYQLEQLVVEHRLPIHLELRPIDSYLREAVKDRILVLPTLLRRGWEGTRGHLRNAGFDLESLRNFLRPTNGFVQAA
jgi:hypothetical protein